MQRGVSFLTFAVALAMSSSLDGEELGSRLPSGPAAGEKIEEFDSTGASKRHLCWSCYG